MGPEIAFDVKVCVFGELFREICMERQMGRKSPAYRAVRYAVAHREAWPVWTSSEIGRRIHICGLEKFEQSFSRICIRAAAFSVTREALGAE